MTTDMQEQLNGKALMAIYDFLSATRVTAGYLEFECDSKALADSLNAARMHIEAPAAAFYAQMDTDDQAILDADSGEPTTFEAVGHDYHAYIYAFTNDNAYLAKGDPFENFISVIKALDEAIQFTLLALREALNCEDSTYIDLLRKVVIATVHSREVLELLAATAPSPKVVAFVPENYPQLNAPMCITAMTDVDGLSKKFPIPLQGQLFHKNEDGSLPLGPADIQGVGRGVVFSTRSVKDIETLTSIYAQVAVNWANGLS